MYVCMYVCMYVVCVTLRNPIILRKCTCMCASVCLGMSRSKRLSRGAYDGLLLLQASCVWALHNTCCMSTIACARHNMTLDKCLQCTARGYLLHIRISSYTPTSCTESSICCSLFSSSVIDMSLSCISCISWLLAAIICFCPSLSFLVYKWVRRRHVHAKSTFLWHN